MSCSCRTHCYWSNCHWGVELCSLLLKLKFPFSLFLLYFSSPGDFLNLFWCILKVSNTPSGKFCKIRISRCQTFKTCFSPFSTPWKSKLKERLSLAELKCLIKANCIPHCRYVIGLFRKYKTCLKMPPECNSQEFFYNIDNFFLFRWLISKCFVPVVLFV